MKNEKVRSFLIYSVAGCLIYETPTNRLWSGNLKKRQFCQMRVTESSISSPKVFPEEAAQSHSPHFAMLMSCFQGDLTELWDDYDNLIFSNTKQYTHTFISISCTLNCSVTKQLEPISPPTQTDRQCSSSVSELSQVPSKEQLLMLLSNVPVHRFQGHHQQQPFPWSD